jgi:hypothetical protein
MTDERLWTLVLVIARSAATEQSIFAASLLDCFEEPAIERRFAPTRWLAMMIREAQ